MRTSTGAAALALFCMAAACAPQTVDPEAPPPGQQTGRPAGGVVIRFADLINIDIRDVPLLMAFDALAAQGYTVEKTYLSSSTVIIDGLARGEFDVAMTNTQTAWAAVAKGADIRTIVEAVGPSNLLVAHERIRSCRDLDDRPLGVANTSGFSPLLLDLYLERQCPGAVPRTVVLPEAGARVAALMAGRVDATMLPADDLVRLQREMSARVHVLMSHADLPEIRIDALHVRRAWAAEHPQAVDALLRAQLDAHRTVIARPDVLHQEAVRRFGLDYAAARVIGDMHLGHGLWNPNGGLTRENVQSTLDVLQTRSGLPPDLDVDRVSDLSFLERVLDQIGRAP